jgi:hypothetical protein
MRRHQRVRPAWFDDVVVGSVLREGSSGPLRVVRAVKRIDDGRMWVTLAIRRCSWTGRPTTTLTCSDLLTRKFYLVPVKPVKLKGDFNARLEASMEYSGPSHLAPMRCCEVLGVP